MYSIGGLFTKILGIPIKKNENWYSVVSGTTKQDAIIEETG